MAQYSSGTDIWSVGPEEKLKHEKTFQSLNPLHGKLSGEQSKKYFMKSNLPTPVLGQIWSLSDLDKDGRMTLQEFTIAMHLLENKLKGATLPTVLPSSLRSSTSPSHHGFPTGPQPLQPMASQMTPMSMSMNPSMTGSMNPPSAGQMNNQMTSMIPMNSGMIQPMQSQAMFGMSNMPPQQMGMPMMTNGFGYASQGPINRVGSVPASLSGNFSGQQATMNSSYTLPNYNKQQQQQPIFGHGVSGANKPTSSLDTLAMEGFKSLNSNNTPTKKQPFPNNTAATPVAQSSLQPISAPNRLKYTQMFKAADNNVVGYIAGEQARQLLIQSNVNPQFLAQIWELSDINKDGQLELEEFIVAMHLIDSVKSGATLPQALPLEFIPPHLQNLGAGDKARSDSLGDLPQGMLPNYEDKRRQNWDKGQMELERRRRELQEKQQREKDERERKEREETERKMRIKEEQERKRFQELENKRRQQEEMEREQEALRKKMIEERLAAQLEAEKQRQREWEKRRKEELLNQKQHEQNIVNELKNRLQKLKDDLLSETSSRDTLSATYEKKKAEGLELHAAIERLVKSRENRMKDITRLQTQLKESESKLNIFIEEREKFTLELNLKDSTQTGEALGAIKSSVQQMRSGMSRLKKNLISIEAETATALKESNKISQQHKELRAKLQIKASENHQLKEQVEMKKREEFERRKTIEANERKLAEHNKKQKELRDKLESNMSKQREREEEAMKKEKQIQEATQKKRQEARNLAKIQAEAAIQKQLKSKDEIVQKQQDALNVKVPPSRPRSRPQASPTKTMPISSIDFSKLDQGNKTPEAEPIRISFNQKQPDPDAFTADFSAFSEMGTSSPATVSEPPKEAKKPPPRPTAPAISKDKENKDDNKKKQKEDEKKRKEEEKKRKKEEEAKKKADEAERKRLEKEKDEIERLKREQAEKDRKLAEKLQKEEEERQIREREEQEQQQAEKLKEDAKKKKEEDVKRKVEEMQRKRMEKKQAAASQKAPQKAPESVISDIGLEPEPVQQYVKKTMFKVMFDFEARNPDELTITEGDIVQVRQILYLVGPLTSYTSKVDESDTTVPAGWLRGTFKGADGLFPANYASKVQNDNFSDYVDLDPRAKSQEMQNQEVQPKQEQPKPQARKPSKKINEPKAAEPMPKLRPVNKPVAAASAGGSRPKSAMLPTTNLKPLQPVKQQRTKDTNSADLSLRYDFVTGPAAEAPPQTEPVQEDLYAVPMKAKSMDNLSSNQPAVVVEDPFAGQNPFPDDIYQVPGEVVQTSTTAGADENFEAVALYPYLGKKDDHLTFNKNDVITVQQQQDQWWFGTCNANNGWFPKSYVKPLGTVNVRKTSQQQSAAEPVTETASTGTPTETTGKCVALFGYSGQEGDLVFHEGDVIEIIKNEGEWWEGRLNGIAGLFPANYVQMKEAEPEIIINKKPEVAQVITKYVANSENEISLNAGQLVHVLQKNSNGWWQGELQVRGKNKPNGWFPGSHVKLMSKGKSDLNPQQAPTTTTVAAASVPTTTTTTESQHVAQQEDIYSVPVKRKDQQEQVLAMFSYTAQNEDELTFYKGSVINVISKDGDWWKGDMNGTIGVFPFNYVQPLGSDMQETTSQCIVGRSTGKRRVST